MINGIVAVERSQGIGFNGQMPWPYLKHDMLWFKKLTTNNIVIMGSTTWRSLGKALPNRINIVLSKKIIAGDHTFTDPSNALEFCNIEYPDKEIFIIGGDSIYKQYQYVINKYYVTEIDTKYNCDKFFNLLYVQKMFLNVKIHAQHTDPIPYTIKEYTL
jgi:dihydrofolate reductase